ncbi:hypothetical protein T484DRAFT_1623922, partial [Baffinella frigidus]
PETRNPKPETRNPKPETRNPKPETRNPEPCLRRWAFWLQQRGKICRCQPPTLTERPNRRFQTSDLPCQHLKYEVLC